MKNFKDIEKLLAEIAGENVLRGDDSTIAGLVKVIHYAATQINIFDDGEDSSAKVIINNIAEMLSGEI